jgi:hypothetical protein
LKIMLLVVPKACDRVVWLSTTRQCWTEKPAIGLHALGRDVDVHVLVAHDLLRRGHRRRVVRLEHDPDFLLGRVDDVCRVAALPAERVRAGLKDRRAIARRRMRLRRRFRRVGGQPVGAGFAAAAEADLGHHHDHGFRELGHVHGRGHDHG